MLKRFKIKTSKKEQLVNITDKVKNIVEKSDVKSGICIVYISHTTAGILVNENYDPSVGKDILNQLKVIAPKSKEYNHDKIDNNADSHIKASILGPSQTFVINKGRLEIGRWQNIVLAEFDGPNSEREVFVKIIKD